jgi:hypothetical protein
MGQMKHWLLFSVRVYTHTHHKRARQAGGPFTALYRSHFCAHIHVNVFILGVMSVWCPSPNEGVWPHAVNLPALSQRTQTSAGWGK